MSLYKFLVYTVGPLFRGLYRIKVYGTEHIPADGALVLCCNHRSNIDPVTLGAAVGKKRKPKRQVFYMAKKELFENKALKWLITKLGAFPVSRGESDSSAIETAYEILRRGDILGIFPEGTRSKDGNLLRFKSGAALISQQSGAPVLPAAIIFEEKMGVFRRTTVRFGEVMTPQELGLDSGSASALRKASRTIMDRVQALLEEGF